MKSYKKPVLNVERFTPNEFVANSCGDSGVVYKFRCDAGGGVYGSVYEESNGIPGLQTGWRGDDELAGYSNSWFGESGYHACDETHEAASTDPFVDGYYCAKGDTRNPVPVIVWKEPRGGWLPDNIHCTTNLNQDSWEIARS